MGLSKPAGNGSAEGQMQPGERRKNARYGCRGFAEVIVANACFLFRGSIRDISRTGCYIESQARLALKRGTEVELLFTVQGDQFKISARVMIIRPAGGAGFEFVAGDAKTQHRLAALIEKLSVSSPGDPALPAGAPIGGLSEGRTRNLW